MKRLFREINCQCLGANLGIDGRTCQVFACDRCEDSLARFMEPASNFERFDAFQQPFQSVRGCKGKISKNVRCTHRMYSRHAPVIEKLVF